MLEVQKTDTVLNFVNNIDSNISYIQTEIQDDQSPFSFEDLENKTLGYKMTVELIVGAGLDYCVGGLNFKGMLTVNQSSSNTTLIIEDFEKIKNKPFDITSCFLISDIPEGETYTVKTNNGSFNITSNTVFQWQDSDEWLNIPENTTGKEINVLFMLEE
jgi:hypothetical protein